MGMNTEIVVYAIIGALALLAGFLVLRERIAEKRRQIDADIRCTPFAQDGTLRDDLMAVTKVDGRWITNPEPNDGFYPLGVMREESPE